MVAGCGESYTLYLVVSLIFFVNDFLCVMMVAVATNIFIYPRYGALMFHRSQLLTPIATLVNDSVQCLRMYGFYSLVRIFRKKPQQNSTSPRIFYQICSGSWIETFYVRIFWRSRTNFWNSHVEALFQYPSVWLNESRGRFRVLRVHRARPAMILLGLFACKLLH